MDNWYYQAIVNGIGGVPCGALEDQHRPDMSIASMKVKIEIVKFLTESFDGRYRDLALLDGYIKKVFSATKEEIKKIELFNARVDEKKDPLKREASMLQNVFRKKYRVAYSKAGSGKTDEEKKDLAEISNLKEQIKKLPSKKKPPKDVYNITQEGYKAYREMFGVANEQKYRYIYK